MLNVYQLEVDSNQQHNRHTKHPLQILRRTILAIIAVNRLTLLKSSHSYTKYNEGTLPIFKTQVPLPKTSSDFNESDTLELIFSHPYLSEATYDMNSLTQFRASSGHSHTTLSPLVHSLNSKLETQCKQLQQYKRAANDLQETSIELHKLIEILTLQRNELRSDNQLQIKHIQSLEKIISRLELSLRSSKNSSEQFTNIHSEPSCLTELLESFVNGYTKMEQLLEDKTKYMDTVIAELNNRNKIIEHLEEEAAEARNLRLQLEIVSNVKDEENQLQPEFSIEDVSRVGPRSHPLHSTSSFNPLP